VPAMASPPPDQPSRQASVLGKRQAERATDASTEHPTKRRNDESPADLESPVAKMRSPKAKTPRAPGRQTADAEMPSKSTDEGVAGLNATVALLLSAGKQLEARSAAPRPPLPPRRTSPPPTAAPDQHARSLAETPAASHVRATSLERGSPVTSDDGDQPPFPPKLKRMSRSSGCGNGRAVPEKRESAVTQDRRCSTVVPADSATLRAPTRKSQTNKMAALWAVAEARRAEANDDAHSSCSSDGPPLVPVKASP
jgi:hypothetical protein